MKRVKGVIPDLWKSFESEMNKDDTDKNIVRTMKRIDAILKGEGVTIGRVEHNFALACNISEFTTKLYEWLNDDEREYVDKKFPEPFFMSLTDVADTCVLKSIVEASSDASQNKADQMVAFIYELSRTETVSVCVDFGIGCLEHYMAPNKTQEEIEEIFWNEFVAVNEHDGICSVLRFGGKKSYSYSVKMGVWEDYISDGDFCA